MTLVTTSRHQASRDTFTLYQQSNQGLGTELFPLDNHGT